MRDVELAAVDPYIPARLFWSRDDLVFDLMIGRHLILFFPEIGGCSFAVAELCQYWCKIAERGLLSL